MGDSSCDFEAFFPLVPSHPFVVSYLLSCCMFQVVDIESLNLFPACPPSFYKGSYTAWEGNGCCWMHRSFRGRRFDNGCGWVTWEGYPSKDSHFEQSSDKSCCWVTRRKAIQQVSFFLGRGQNSGSGCCRVVSVVQCGQPGPAWLQVHKNSSFWMYENGRRIFEFIEMVHEYVGSQQTLKNSMMRVVAGLWDPLLYSFGFLATLERGTGRCRYLWHGERYELKIFIFEK